MKKIYKYNIVGLDCANCARNLEIKLNEVKNLKNVVVNFATSKLSFESDKNIDLKELNKIVKKVDKNITIVENNNLTNQKKYNIITLLIGVLLGIVGCLFNIPEVLEQILLVISYFLLLYKTGIKAVNLLVKNRTIDENILIIISCLGAYLLGQNLEGIMVITLYIIGKILEEKAINNTRNSINELLILKPDFANKKEQGKIVEIPVEDVKKNDIIVIKKGEKVPVDGIVVKGSTLLDASMLTGEQEHVSVKENDNVLSGEINVENLIEVKVVNEFKESTISRILSLVEDATDKKSHVETLVTKISKIYTPTVLFLAVLITLLLPNLLSISFNQSFYRGLTFLVISCPCAIAISVPLSYFTGIGVSSKNGILIKGSNYLDNLVHMNKLIFDKTGTLTTGTFEVSNIKIFDSKYSKEKIIEMLIKGEINSSHPVANSILKLSNEKVDNSDIKNFKEINGKGISYELGNDIVKIGNSKMCECKNETTLHLNVNGIHVASIDINDGIKSDGFDSIKKLNDYNIETYMFTGDKKNIALEIGRRIGISNISYEMLPTDKYYEYEKIKKKDDIVGFVGDGINDAPVLKRADIGIAMGGVGSTIAIESSDIVLMSDEIKKIPLAIKISKYTNLIIKQNLFFAIGMKLTVLILSTLGLATMWFAVFADTGVTLITILNTLRIFKKFSCKNKRKET